MWNTFQDESSRIQGECRRYGFYIYDIVTDRSTFNCHFGSHGDITIHDNSGLYSGSLYSRKLPKVLVTHHKLTLFHAMLSLLIKLKRVRIRRSPVKMLDFPEVNIRFFYSRINYHGIHDVVNHPIDSFKYGKPTFIVVKEDGTKRPVLITWSEPSAEHLIKAIERTDPNYYDIYQGKATQLDWQKPVPKSIRVKNRHSRGKTSRSYWFLLVHRPMSFDSGKVFGL